MKIRAFALAAALAGLGITAVTAADEPQAVRQQLMKKVGQAAGALGCDPEAADSAVCRGATAGGRSIVNVVPRPT